MKRKDKIFWTTIGVLLALPAIVLATPLIKPGNYQICCAVANVDCEACHSYNCCYSGCSAGYNQSSPPQPCSLINCADSCCAAAGC